MTGQEAITWDVAQVPILVEYLRVTAMEMMNVPIPSCVDLITALASSHLLLTVV